MKKKALKGLTALLILLVACFFFSGTIKALTTAKGLFVSPKHGKLKEQITLTGILTFSETEDIVLSNPPAGVTYTITKVHVTKGSYVNAGDILFETGATGVNEAIQTQETIYLDAEKELLALERKYTNLRLTRTEQTWIDTYDALLEASFDSHMAHLDLEETAVRFHVELPEGRIPEGTTEEELISAQNAVDQADQTLNQAQTVMNRANRTGISEDAYQYTMQKRNLERTMSMASETIVSLRTARSVSQIIQAPHDGYVLDVCIKKGDRWDGKTAAIVLSGEGSDCLFRTETGNLARNISIGTSATIEGRSGNQVKGRVTAIGYGETGTPYLDIPVSYNDLALIDKADVLLTSGASVSMSIVSDAKGVLLPAGTIRGTKDSPYIYVAVESQNAFGQSTFVVEKQNVTVLDETTEMVIVSDLSDDYQVIYMEDRAISEGSEVMEYEE